MVIIYILTALVISFQEVMSYIEIVEESGFDNSTLRLTCRHLDSVIIILDTTFLPFDDNRTYEEDIQNPNSLSHPRLALNQRCSGVNHCSFILNEDCPGADKWGPGNITIKYACVAEKERIKYCNQDIILPSAEEVGISEGYVHNPGYPRFYLGHQDCRWKIKSTSQQRIKLTILDLSLIGTDEQCQDLLVVKDSDQTVFSSCVQEEPPMEIMSISDTLEITLTSSEMLIPRRGVLFHFTAVGCFTPNTPKDGYLVYKNDSVAVFSCCAGYAFPDSCKKIKVLKCLGYKWDKPLPLPDCDSNTKIKDPGQIEVISTQSYLAVKIPSEAKMSDLIAPILLIVLLFAVNAVVLFVIFRYRKRKAATPVCTEEELKTFSVTNNGGSLA